MATRIYTTATAPPISPTATAGWEDVASITRLLGSRTAADYVQSNIATPNGTGVANDDLLFYQIIYGPISAGALTGTVKGQFFAREANAALDGRAQIVIRIMDSTGTTSRGTSLNFDTGVLANEFAVAAGTQTNRKFPRAGATSLTSVTAQDGDYIVIEVGERNHGTSATAVRIATGDSGTGSADLPEDETTTSGSATVYRGWVEFSQTISPYVEVDPTVAAATGAALNAKLTIAPTLTAPAAAVGAAYDATISFLTPPRTVTIGGADYTNKIRWDSFVFTECANRGQVGMGSIAVDDAANALDIPAMKAFAFEEPAAGASNKYVFTGYTHDRDTERGPNRVAGQRQWGVEVLDLNTLADDYVLTNAETADRPAETDYVRVAWLLTSRFNSVANVGVGYVPNSNTANMDAVDYRGRTARDVLNECSEMAGKNWFIYLDGASTTPKLFYDVTSGTNYTSTSKISDVYADVDSSTTWAVQGPPKVHKSPDDIYSTIHLTYNGGTVSVTNATTASTYRTREIPVLDMSVDTSAKATAKANAFLAACAVERIRVESVTVTLPAANVNDFRAGQRFQLKLDRHGITAFTYYRIVQREIRPLNDVAYQVTLTLADSVLPTLTGSGRGGDIYGIWEKKSNATDDGATVIVDRNGINVIDGAITVVNPTGTTIIDGTSDIFKIAAQGTQSVSCATKDTDTTSTTLGALGTLSECPVALCVHSGSNVPTAQQWLGMSWAENWGIVYTANSSGGSPTLAIGMGQCTTFGYIKLVASPGNTSVHLNIANGTAGSVTRYQKYFVLVETGF